ncbi:NAD(P)H-dependent oxidoreductase [Nocardiopsis rhodophaea]|uniref:NADPH-dependent FMN reductase n=1 Tax=Nocardiopsis rhodophaea TaxID=280238 RepID=UPI0031E18F41
MEETRTADRRLRVAVIIGSTRKGRFAPTAATWFASLARRRDDLEVDVIDLARTGLPEVLAEDGDPRPTAVSQLSPWLTEADAFVVVTPEYNQSFPGALKNAIDWFNDEWRAKPVAFVAYGGESGGRHAVAQLRLVFTEVEAVTVRDIVSISDHQRRYDDQGRPAAPRGCDSAAARVLDRLTWWGRALSGYRDLHPYES